jgi:pSer/pThr/pTyr-binding forkhead associated (FHA) protein
MNPMLLHYTHADGTPAEFTLSERPITIGRSLDADVVIDDEKASRIHCGIRFLDGTYQLRDLKSKNGTYVNEERIESVEIRSGDRIRVGGCVFRVESSPLPGADTAVHEVEEEMADGKGYGTILREIVKAVDEPPRPKEPLS